MMRSYEHIRRSIRHRSERLMIKYAKEELMLEQGKDKGNEVESFRYTFLKDLPFFRTPKMYLMKQVSVH